MERRTFLTVCVGTGVAAAHLAWPGAPLTDLFGGLAPSSGPGWQVDGRALCPGAPLQVTLAAEVPVGSRVRLLVDHQGRRHDAGAFAVTPGATLTLETPYPFDDLVPGAYSVLLTLEGPLGQSLAACPVGSYTLQRFRFSA